MKKRILVPALILGALLSGSLAMAGPGGCGACDQREDCGGRGQGSMNFEQHEDRMDQRLEMMSAVLDLTAEQKVQLEGLMTQQWQVRQQLLEKMKASRDALREVQTAEIFNEADYLAKAVKQAELKTEMMAERAKMKKQLYAVLTPEQQEKADKLSEMMGKRGKGRHGGFGF